MATDLLDNINEDKTSESNVYYSVTFSSALILVVIRRIVSPFIPLTSTGFCLYTMQSNTSPTERFIVALSCTTTSLLRTSYGKALLKH
ncbi:hypothetical protein M514_03211 [Trichuris suis]|uniref:Uncharacterized protein n=1 Tax=Trichuris suis TaxID=68888 RepID=A0A085MW14_9BILA|nr:hypothetical protein M514_03211 [Trichuris suis]